jgi:ribose/xylose/arabinose/galactoside ABC-type transport system permease subunit
MKLRASAGAPGALGRLRGALPLALMTTLIVALGAYAAVHQAAFLTSYNLNNLLLATMPLALVSLGQTSALLVGGFDVSVGALMTMCVVTASFTMQPGSSWFVLLLGALALIGLGLATGLFNATLIRPFRLPSIIATLGTLSILQGVALLLRDHPDGPINSDVIGALTTSVGLVPVAFIGVVVLAVAADLMLYRTRPGLALRAVGLDETSSRRLGMGTGRTVILAFVVCSLLASVAGFYLAAEVQIGSPLIGSQALESIAAAVLGGASLAGGKGSFVGTLLAALFLTLIDNVLPLFQQPTEYAEMTIGVLILLALVLYQAPELVARFRASRLARLQTR